MGEMRTMGAEGDTRVTWDAENDDEIETARQTFERLRKKGYNAYQVTRQGNKGEVVRTFDPDAEKIILAAPMAGG